MHDTFLLHKLHDIYKLRKHNAEYSLSKLILALFDQLIEVAVDSHLEDEVQVDVVLERAQQVHDVRMIQLVHEIALAHHMLHLIELQCLVLINRFDSDFAVILLI